MGKLKPARRTVALATLIVGAAIIATGVGLVYVPAGVITAGTAAVLIALLVIDVDSDDK